MAFLLAWVSLFPFQGFITCRRFRVHHGPNNSRGSFVLVYLFDSRLHIVYWPYRLL